jgi:hypothetical protein
MVFWLNTAGEMDNKQLVILGMHRSGTSFLAQAIHQLGINLGDEIGGANYGNLKGYYEDLDFLRLHQEILAENNLESTGLYGDITNITINDENKRRIKKNIKVKNSIRTQWGWKEPRTCLFLNEYTKLLPKAKYLIIYRNPFDVVNSLLKREIKSYKRSFQNKIIRTIKEYIYIKILRNYAIKRKVKKIIRHKEYEYYKKWIDYNNRILKHLENCQIDSYFIINFDNVEDYNESLLKKLNYWGFEINNIPLSAFYDKSIVKRDSNIVSTPFNNYSDTLKIFEEYRKLEIMINEG